MALGQKFSRLILAGHRMSARITNFRRMALCLAPDLVEQVGKIALVVDIFLAMAGDDEKLAFGQAEAGENVGSLIAGTEMLEHLMHVRTYIEGQLGRQALSEQIAPGVLGQRHVDVGEMIDDPAVEFFGDTLIEAAIAGFHVEDWDLAPLG